MRGFEFGYTKAISDGTDEVVLRKSHEHILQKEGGSCFKAPWLFACGKGLSLGIHFVQVLMSQRGNSSFAGGGNEIRMVQILPALSDPRTMRSRMVTTSDSSLNSVTVKR